MAFTTQNRKYLRILISFVMVLQAPITTANLANFRRMNRPDLHQIVRSGPHPIFYCPLFLGHFSRYFTSKLFFSFNLRDPVDFFSGVFAQFFKKANFDSKNPIKL